MRLVNETNWANIDYTLPDDVFHNRTRTSYRVAHRHIPSVRPQYHCKTFAPITGRILEKNEVVMREAYRTSSGVHTKLKRTRPTTSFHERHPCSTNVHYMTFSHEKMEKHSHGAKRQMISETKDVFQNRPKSSPPIRPHSSCRHSMISDHPEYREFDLNKERGHDVHLDPYLTTSRAVHTNFPRRCSSAKDNVNYSNYLTYPKVAGMNMAAREIWTPMTTKIKHTTWGNENFAYDQLTKNIPNALFWTPSAFTSETKQKFTPPNNSFKLHKLGHPMYSPGLLCV